MQLIIYGTGKQAEMTHYFFTHDSPFEVVAFCVEAAYLPAESATLLGLPIVAFEELPTRYPTAAYHLHIAVGQIKARRRLYEQAKALGYPLASYISSRAQHWPDLEVGEHVFIDPVMHLHPFVRIGDNVMLIGSKIGHHTVIGSHTLMSGVTVGGNASIGEGSFIGMGAVINENVRVGIGNIIGAGAQIGRHTDDYAVYTGQYSKKRQVSADRVSLF